MRRRNSLTAETQRTQRKEKPHRSLRLPTDSGQGDAEDAEKCAEEF